MRRKPLRAGRAVWIADGRGGAQRATYAQRSALHLGSVQVCYGGDRRDWTWTIPRERVFFSEADARNFRPA